MRTNNRPNPPHPRAVYDALVESLDLYHLSNLPRILDLFAHIQILSSQVHRQARRALELQATLVAQLGAKGIEERAWVRYGALTKAQGGRLRELRAEEYEEGIRREDAMMELSFQLRLIHIVTLLTKPRVALSDIENVMKMYFPPIRGPDDFEDTAAWRGYIRSSGSRCYIRAMSSDQARRFDLYRQRAEGALSRTKQAGRRLSRQEIFRDLTDEQEGLCVEEMRNLAREVIAEVEEMVRVFDVPEGGAENAPEHGISGSPDVDGDVEMVPPLEIDDDIGQADPPDLDYIEPDEEQLEIEAEAYRSPPPIRAPRSSMAFARPEAWLSSAAQPRSVSITQTRMITEPVATTSRSPSTLHKGRPSGLPPPTGPDYTKHRTPSSSTQKRPLKPFSSNKLQNRGNTAGQVKRSRASMGALSTATGIDIDGRDAKRRRAHSDD